eukprot:365261-Chlamydomonas_euryale.AAC.3
MPPVLWDVELPQLLRQCAPFAAQYSKVRSGPRRGHILRYRDVGQRGDWQVRQWYKVHKCAAGGSPTAWHLLETRIRLNA